MEMWTQLIRNRNKRLKKQALLKIVIKAQRNKDIL